MKKVIVIGCPGAGKSTFSRLLSEKTGLPLYHLDLIWHKPDRTTVSREEFDRKLALIIEKEEWIIDGNYGRTLGIRIKACDTVFLFDLPTESCLEGAMARIGKKREDMPWTEETLDPEFKEWIVNFARDEMPRVYSLIETYKDKNIVIFKSHKEVDEYAEGWQG
ncbi:MAG: adenylate kinase [Ruminococcaceae bacterium]|nr:adenylate kinase [Oscillospiraceae bacterium]